MGRQDSSGSVLVLTALLLPALLALVGLVIDGAVLIRSQILLGSAVDAAARAATDAYDQAIWESERRVVIDPGGARSLAETYLKANMPAAELEEVTVPGGTPNQVRVVAFTRVKFHFIKIVGIKESEIRSFSSAKKV